MKSLHVIPGAPQSGELCDALAPPPIIERFGLLQTGPGLVVIRRFGEDGFEVVRRAPGLARGQIELSPNVQKLVLSVRGRRVLPKSFGDIRDPSLAVGRCLHNRPSFGIQ